MIYIESEIVLKHCFSPVFLFSPFAVVATLFHSICTVTVCCFGCRVCLVIGADHKDVGICGILWVTGLAPPSGSRKCVTSSRL